MAKFDKRIRNYKAEYKRRIALGEARKLSRSQARGHPKAKESYVSRKPGKAISEQKLQLGLKELRSGESLTSVAKKLQVSPDKLRNYFKSRKAIAKKGNRWLVKKRLPRQVLIISQNKEFPIIVGNFDTASFVGRYRNAVRKFLRTNNPQYLQPFTGKSVKDIQGQKYVLETDKNTLYRLNSSATESYEQVYKIII